MRGYNPGLNSQSAPQQSQELINPQTLGMLMQAYKGYQAQQGLQTPGATGTSYAGGQMQGTGYQMGQPLVAGGQSGQPSQTSNPALLQAMLQSRQMGQ